MNGLSPYMLQHIKDTYPPGTRVELVYMNDRNAPPVGTKGTVRIVDDIGTIHVSWDNGSGLGVVYDEDQCRKVVDK